MSVMQTLATKNVVIVGIFNAKNRTTSGFIYFQKKRFLLYFNVFEPLKWNMKKKKKKTLWRVIQVTGICIFMANLVL